MTLRSPLVSPLDFSYFQGLPMAHTTPAIGIDLDGCIDEATPFFKALTHSWPGKTYVITFRSDAEKARRDVEGFGIKCDEVVLVSSFEAKADVIAEKGVSIYFDDQDEILMPHAV